MLRKNIYYAHQQPQTRSDLGMRNNPCHTPQQPNTFKNLNWQMPNKRLIQMTADSGKNDQMKRTFPLTNNILKSENN